MGGAGELGLRELVAIGIGGMIGGGIFSVLGLAVSLAGAAAPWAFAVGGLVALLAGYAYVRLALSFHSDGASFTYLEHAFPDRPFIGSFTGWLVVVGYIGTLALYAFTFGAYAAELLHLVDSHLVRQGLSTGIVLVFAYINLRGARSSGLAEDLIVYSKVLLLVLLAVAGMSSVDEERFRTNVDHDWRSIVMAGALIFVAYEGFQLITNAVCESRQPERNIPRGIYISIAVVTLIYVSISAVAVGSLDVQALVEAREYALAVAARPALGDLGTVLVCLAAMLSTASAINATMFGAARMMAEMAVHGEMPKPFSFRNRAAVPWLAVVIISAVTLGLATLGGLAFIASFSSLTFLAVSLSVCLSNWRLRRVTGANPFLSAMGLLMLALTIATLVYYLLTEQPQTCLEISSMYLVVLLASMTWHLRNRARLHS
ncbi:MAG: amino acid permease [Zetaproteobacteria bacterium]|nr:MAG: amino acid permease [Zetaproteobacteria bacterium]